MHSCLSIHFILREITSKLNLREKFGVQAVCRQWKHTAIQCLRHHEYLVISECVPSSVWFCYNCDGHPSALTVKNDNLVLGKQTDLEFWKRTLSLLQGVKYAYLVLRTDDEISTSFSIFKSLFSCPTQTFIKSGSFHTTVKLQLQVYPVILLIIPEEFIKDHVSWKMIDRTNGIIFPVEYLIPPSFVIEAVRVIDI